MTTLTKTLVLALVAAAGLSLNPAAAQAEDTHFAVTVIENSTNLRIAYHYRWGESGEWKTSTLEPGRYDYHWFRYEYPNQNRSPKLYVRFDTDGADDSVSVKEYWLVSYASPTNGPEHGKWYRFEYVDGSRRFIDMAYTN